MSRKFIASIALSALVAASLSAAPARADDRDTARAIAGIAALVLLGKAISDRNDDRRDQHSYHAKPQNQHGHGVRRPVRARPEAFAPACSQDDFAAAVSDHGSDAP